MAQSLLKPAVFVIIKYIFAYNSQIPFLGIQLRAVIVYAHKKFAHKKKKKKVCTWMSIEALTIKAPNWKNIRE